MDKLVCVLLGASLTYFATVENDKSVCSYILKTMMSVEKDQDSRDLEKIDGQF